MVNIKSFDELKIPEKHKTFLKTFLNRIAHSGKERKVILFGSCARGTASVESDIDIAVLSEKMSDEDYIELCDYLPDYENDAYVECDLITMSFDVYNKNLTEIGYVQRHIEREGIDLSGLIQ